MKPAEEDALVEEVVAKYRSSATPFPQCIRLAIRAAVAHERERAARVCIDMNNGWCSDDHLDCAAAIRRGE